MDNMGLEKGEQKQRANKAHQRTSRRELVTDFLSCELKLFCGLADWPVMGFLAEVQAFCWTGGADCLCGCQSGVTAPKDWMSVKRARAWQWD